jgi:hypothetical protein
MAKADYYRPADYQVNHIYQCNTCRREHEQSSIYGVGKCPCGGTFQQVGESYPASVDEWDEERDDTNSDWHRRR